MKSDECYCGTFEKPSENKLQCYKCKRWYHEGCISCFDWPLLLGDKFFIFVCSRCNAGEEYLARVELKWGELIHLVLYNLTKTGKKKYFDLDHSIMPFISQNWTRLQPAGEVTMLKPERRQERVSHILSHARKRFKSGKEVRKRGSLWALRIVEPPTPPYLIQLISSNENVNSSLNFHVKGRVLKVINSKKNIIPHKNNMLQSQKHATKLKNHLKNGKIAKCRSSIPRLENGSRKIPTSKIKKENEIPRTDDDIAIYGLLDSCIPHPENFKGCNNPFRNLNFVSKSATAKMKRNKISKSVNIPKSTDSKKCHEIFSSEKKKRKLTNCSVSCYSVLGTRNKTLNLDHVSRVMNVAEERNSNNELAFVGAKAFLSQCLQTSEYLARKQGLRVVGKRVTLSGKVQYLVEWDR